VSKITNDDLTRSGTVCFVAVPVWQQRPSGRQRVNDWSSISADPWTLVLSCAGRLRNVIDYGSTFYMSMRNINLTAVQSVASASASHPVSTSTCEYDLTLVSSLSHSLPHKPSN